MIAPIGSILARPYLKTGLDRKQLLREYKQLRLARIQKYASPGKKAALIKELEKDLTKYGYEMKIPEKFKKYPVDKIRIAAYPNFLRSEPDPDSPTGRAFGSPPEKEDRRHIMKRQIGGCMPSWFGVYDYETRKAISLQLNDIPQDEKYHWYKIGRFEIGKRSVLWGFFWCMMVNLESFWTQADGIKDFNVWTIWISAKFTGPAYVKNSTRPNRIFLDQIVFVKE